MTPVIPPLEDWFANTETKAPIKLIYEHPVANMAYRIAKWAHADQFRNDGKTPYMTHINEVIKNSWNLIHCNTDHVIELQVPYIIALAALHDVLEDQADKITVTQIEKLLNIQGFNLNCVFFNSLAAITKTKGQNYLAYILGVKSFSWAKTVKLADLAHNMSDLQEGNMLSKYQLAQHILRYP